MTRKTSYTSLGAALVALTIVGCGPREKTPEVPPPPAPVTNSQVPPDVTGAALGMRQKAGDFMVTLQVEGAVKKGQNRFTATVTRDGKPEPDATVRVLLTMPGMNMYGADLVLSPAIAGHYEGNGNLTMAGDWQANVTVTQGESTGETVYDFRV